MMQESGKGTIKATVLLMIIIAIIVMICMAINKNIKTQKSENIVSNMMLIKGTCKVFNENRIRNQKGEEELIGTKLSDIGQVEEKSDDKGEENKEDSENKDESDNSEENNNNTDDEITKTINEFKNTQNITEEEYKKYYVLTDKNLEELKIDVKNEEKSYYLINYETNEVIITKGYEGKYKLSEIEKAIEETKNKEEKEEKKETDTNEKKDE